MTINKIKLDEKRLVGYLSGYEYLICNKCGGPLYPPIGHPKENKSKWCWDCGKKY